LKRNKGDGQPIQYQGKYLRLSLSPKEKRPPGNLLGEENAASPYCCLRSKNDNASKSPGLDMIIREGGEGRFSGSEYLKVPSQKTGQQGNSASESDPRRMDASLKGEITKPARYRKETVCL